MSARFLDDEARAAFKHAVETIEKASSIEVVVALRQRSASYLHANVIVGVLAAFAGLALALYSSRPFPWSVILLDPFVVGLVAGGLVELLSGVKRVLTPHKIRLANVRRAARAAFVERGVHNTVGRSGVLVYISWLEREVVLVADSGVERLLPAAALVEAERALTKTMPKGGVAVARRLEELASHAAVAMPRDEADVNELPDAVHSDRDDKRVDQGPAS